jgi:dolichol kinase
MLLFTNKGLFWVCFIDYTYCKLTYLQKYVLLLIIVNLLFSPLFLPLVFISLHTTNTGCPPARQQRLVIFFLSNFECGFVGSIENNGGGLLLLMVGHFVLERKH